MSKPDIHMVVRKSGRQKRTSLAYRGAVFNTYEDARKAMENHKKAIGRYSKSDAKNVFIKTIKNNRGKG